MQKQKMFVWGLALAMLASSCSQKSESGEVAPVRVKTMTIAAVSRTAGQEYSGTVEEESATSLSFAVPGTVQQVLVSEGQRVGKGQLLAVLDDTSLRSSHASAKAMLQQAEDAYARMKQLHDAGSLPDIQWVEVETKLQQARSMEEIASKQLSDGRLYAPAAGVISKKGVEPGQTVAPGIEVLRLLNVAAVKLKISVPEQEIDRIAIGQEATAAVDALNGRTYAVRVCEKGTVANPLTRSYDVKFSITNADGSLRPGMLCRVSMTVGESTANDMVLPPSVVMLTDKNAHYVWVVSDSTAHRRDITIGGTVAGGVGISSGLKGGDEVITEGMQKVYEGCRITTKF